MEEEPEGDVHGGGPLRVEARLEYRTRALEDWEAFVLVSIRAGGISEDGRQARVEGACVCDVSGSMEGAKNENLKRALHELCQEAMKNAGSLALASFAQEATLDLPMTPMDEDGMDALMSAACRWVPGGGTNLAAGLEVGLSALEQRLPSCARGLLLVLTDGISQTPVASSSVAERLRRCGSTAYFYGIGEDHDPFVLSELAEACKTPFVCLDDVPDIQGAFASGFSAAANTAAVDIRLVAEVPSPASLVDVRSAFQVVEVDQQKREVLIPDLQRGERKDVGVQIFVPSGFHPHAPRPEIIRVWAHYKSSATEVSYETGRVCAYAEEASGEAEEEPDPEVSGQRARLELAEALSAALSSYRRQDPEGVRRELISGERAVARAPHALGGEFRSRLLEARRLVSIPLTRGRTGPAAGALLEAVQNDMFQRELQRGRTAALPPPPDGSELVRSFSCFP